MVKDHFKAMFNPIIFISNRIVHGLFFIDISLEMWIKEKLGKTRTVKYDSAIEEGLNFSFFEIIGGLDYISLFLDIKHAYITTHKNRDKSNRDRDDYQVTMLYRDGDDNYRIFKFLLLISYDDEAGRNAFITARLSKSNLWKFESETTRLSFKINNCPEGERLSDNLNPRVEKEFTSLFEDFTNCNIRF